MLNKILTLLGVKRKAEAEEFAAIAGGDLPFTPGGGFVARDEVRSILGVKPKRAARKKSTAKKATAKRKTTRKATPRKATAKKKA